MGYISTTATEKNNLSSAANSAQTLEAITRTGTRIDFSVKWTGSDGAVAATWAANRQPSVGLLPNTTAPYFIDFGPDPEFYFNGVTWDGTVFPSISIDWAIGTLAGTVKELWYGCTYDGSGNVTGRPLLVTRDNIDPGYGAVGSGRPGPRYTFILSGTETRGYVSYKGVGQKPIVVVAGPKQGLKFPMSLMMYREGTFAIEAVTIGASASLSTVYSVRDQTIDFGSAQSNLHARIYQVGTVTLPDGAPTDVDV